MKEKASLHIMIRLGTSGFLFGCPVVYIPRGVNIGNQFASIRLEDFSGSEVEGYWHVQKLKILFVFWSKMGLKLLVELSIGELRKALCNAGIEGSVPG